MSDNDDRPEFRLAGVPTAAVDAHREEMWTVISRSWSEQAARRKRAKAALGWGAAGLGLAATLLVGIVVGRWSARVGDPEPPAAAILRDSIVLNPPLSMPYRIAVGEHFRDAETLLLLFDASGEADPDPELASLARELAATSRMLMASSVGRDADIRSILLDLELVLVQIARLDIDDPAEVEIVRDGIVETETLARMQRVLAGERDEMGI
jgi:hypothetical protein